MNINTTGVVGTRVTAIHLLISDGSRHGSI